MLLIRSSWFHKTGATVVIWCLSGLCFNIRTIFWLTQQTDFVSILRTRDSFNINKVVSWLFYLYNGNHYTWSWYWCFYQCPCCYRWPTSAPSSAWIGYPHRWSATNWLMPGLCRTWICGWNPTCWLTTMCASGTVSLLSSILLMWWFMILSQASMTAQESFHPWCNNSTVIKACSVSEQGLG